VRLVRKAALRAWARQCRAASGAVAPPFAVVRSALRASIRGGHCRPSNLTASERGHNVRDLQSTEADCRECGRKSSSVTLRIPTVVTCLAIVAAAPPIGTGTWDRLRLARHDLLALAWPNPAQTVTSPAGDVLSFVAPPIGIFRPRPVP